MMTPRQYRVARAVAHGLTRREIAERLDISERTVDSHIRNAAARIAGPEDTRSAGRVVRDFIHAAEGITDTL